MPSSSDLTLLSEPSSDELSKTHRTSTKRRMGTKARTTTTRVIMMTTRRMRMTRKMAKRVRRMGNQPPRRLPLPLRRSRSPRLLRLKVAELLPSRLPHLQKPFRRHQYHCPPPRPRQLSRLSRSSLHHPRSQRMPRSIPHPRSMSPKQPPQCHPHPLMNIPPFRQTRSR